MMIRTRLLTSVALAALALGACGDEPTPELLTVAPVDVERGELVTITGTSFGSSGVLVLTAFSDDSQIDLTDTATEWADEQLVFAIPADFIEQRYLVHVENSDKRSNCLDIEVVLPPDPYITVASPPAGVPGDTITITGTEFSEDQGRVIFSPDVTATITSWSDTEIVVVVPPDVQSDSIRVETGRGLLSPWAPFVVADPNAPTLTLIQNTIFTPACATASCHGTARAGNLSLVDGQSYSELVGVESTALASVMRVVALAPDSSFLIDKLSNAIPQAGSRMPFGQAPLTSGEIELIREWIDQGALDN